MLFHAFITTVFLLPLSLTAYKMLDYATIHETLYQLETDYPDLVDVYSAQDVPFQLPTSGQCGLGQSCQHLYVRVTDETTLPDKDRPELFLSGALHGNERVGPTTTLEFVRYLVEHYTQSVVKPLSTTPVVPTSSPTSTSSTTPSTTTPLDDWLVRLITRRSLWIMPSANAYGYYHDLREENGVDPNRDFPYNHKNPMECMKTIAARAINELWRKHAFQVAITYHAGQESISSTWGGFNHPAPNDVPPDDVCQLSLIQEMSTYGDRFENSNKRYDYGRLNDNVYPVNGGMEDWAYGAGWETAAVGKGCTPTSFGGYPSSQTKYDGASLRVINILVETSNNKSPSDDSFGAREGVLNPLLAGGRGHVPRNIRLALLLADVAEPYVIWFAGSYFVQETVHMMMNDGRLLPGSDTNGLLPGIGTGVEQPDQPVGSSSPVWLYPSSASSSFASRDLLQWSVGGAMNVDDTELVVLKWPKNDFNEMSCRCVTSNSFRYASPIRIDWDKYSSSMHVIGKGTSNGHYTGHTVRAQTPWSAHKSEKFTMPVSGTFTSLHEMVASVDPHATTNNEDYVILTRAQVDGTWGESLPGKRVWPNDLAPQTNLVRHTTRMRCPFSVEFAIAVFLWSIVVNCGQLFSPPLPPLTVVWVLFGVIVFVFDRFVVARIHHGLKSPTTVAIV